MPDDPDTKPPKDLLDWLGLARAPNLAVAKPLGRLFGALVVVVFFAAVAAALSVLYGTIRDVWWTEGTPGPSLGAGALVTAILGAPFLIWGTIIRHQSLRWQKEGHMTDRISKAVEQLGAEKTVFRPVMRDDGTPGLDQNNNPAIYQRTLANLEVRIGAILSLERIAQDSTTHGNGRDHVRVMEILCAYVRENSPAGNAQDHPYGAWEPLKDDPTDEERAAHLERQEHRFPAPVEDSILYRWAQALPLPREDIALALKVISRRTPAQIRVEAAWPAPPDARTGHPAEPSCPTLPDAPGDAPLSLRDLEAFRTELEAWTEALHAYAGYRLDLRGTNLQRADLSEAGLAFARFEGARMEAQISSGRGWRARCSGRRGLRGQTSAKPGCRGQTSRTRGWRGRSLAKPGWRALSSQARRWTGRT